MYHGNVSRIISSAPVRANMTWDCCLYSYLIHIWIGAYTLIEDGAASDVTPQRNQCDLVLRSNMWVDVQAGYHQSTFINKKYISAAPHCLQLPSSQIAKYGQISDIWLKVCWSWTWPSGVSLKMALKMELRNMFGRSIVRFPASLASKCKWLWCCSGGICLLLQIFGPNLGSQIWHLPSFVNGALIFDSATQETFLTFKLKTKSHKVWHHDADAKKIVPTLQKCVFCGDHWLIDRTTKEDQSTELDTIFIFLDIDIDLHLLKECSPQSWRLFPHWISFRGWLVLLLVRSEYLMLGNLTCGYSKPCVLDLKVNINLFLDN